MSHNKIDFERRMAWDKCPTPDAEAHTLDGSVIIDTADATHDAYVWDVTNSDATISYEGELLDVQR